MQLDGVEVKPKWAWSDQYRRELRQQIQATGKSDVSTKERRQQYIAWYAETHGLTEHQAEKALKEQGKLS
jgi:hypothetical protein